MPPLGEVAMTPISRITITKLHQAARGTLAINRIGHNAAPRLIAEEVDEDGDTDKFHVPLAITGAGAFVCRTEERRVGKEGVSTCRSGWSPKHKTKRTNN